ncbi:MAG: hypothetical protein JSR30_00165 [Proteobacteria bacterium]|nr:hypothetical protein [Pseudomonadota bacterium]
MSREVVDHSNPRSALEDQESAEPEESHVQALRHLLAWILDGRDLAAVATRAYIVAYEISPDVIDGMTLHQIAKFSGHGRSATHNLAREFEEIFQVRSVHARSDEARQRCAAAYRKANGYAPHTYNPLDHDHRKKIRTD